jgi:hypothetical protein
MDNSLRQCERDVEAARAKLADDLAVLRSPATVASFTESLKDTALDAKDAVIEQAKDAVRSKVSGFVDELKAKAAANPAAALTIGAGIAWHVVRHPPIATALIGAGLYGLWRSQAVPSNTDYFEHGKERLKEQASELGSSAMDMASEVGDAVAAKAGELADTAKQTVQGWSQSAADSAVNASDAVKAGIETVAVPARRVVHDVRDGMDTAGRTVRELTNRAGQATAEGAQHVLDGAKYAASRATAAVDEMAEDALASGRDIVALSETRDKVLLGVAGLAVAAALGLAYQKRGAEQVE